MTILRPSDEKQVSDAVAWAAAEKQAARSRRGRKQATRSVAR